MLPHAIAEAERFGVELILLKVLEPLPKDPGLLKAIVKQAEERTGALAREYLEHVAADGDVVGTVLVAVDHQIEMLDETINGPCWHLT